MKHNCRICGQELPDLLQPLAENNPGILCGYAECTTTGKKDKEAPRAEPCKAELKQVLEVGCRIELLNIEEMYMDTPQAENGDIAEVTDIIDYVTFNITVLRNGYSKFYVTADWLRKGYLRVIQSPA